MVKSDILNLVYKRVEAEICWKVVKILGLVHTMPDKFQNATLRAKNGTNVLRPHMKRDKMFCVHTTAFLGGCLHSIFGSFSLNFLVIQKFSHHSLRTTTSVTKLRHHALVLPGRIQKLLFGIKRADSMVSLLYCRSTCHYCLNIIIPGGLA